MISKPHVAVLGTKETCLRLVEGLEEAALPYTLVTIDDSNDGRSQLPALQTHGAILATEPAGAYDQVLATAPCAVLIAGWYWLIKSEVLERTGIPFIGMHYSPLPSYRGSSPVVWQLMNGEREVGYSIFKLTSGMDEGPIFASGSVDRGDGYIGSILRRLDSKAIPAMVSVAQQLLEGSAICSPQSSKKVSYAAPRTEQDGLVDWYKRASEIERFVRAQSRPYPGAFSQLNEEIVRIWRATALEIPYYGAPGQIVAFEAGAPIIACGEGTGLRLEEFDSIRGRISGRFSVR